MASRCSADVVNNSTIIIEVIDDKEHSISTWPSLHIAILPSWQFCYMSLEIIVKTRKLTVSLYRLLKRVKRRFNAAALHYVMSSAWSARQRRGQRCRFIIHEFSSSCLPVVGLSIVAQLQPRCPVLSSLPISPRTHEEAGSPAKSPARPLRFSIALIHEQSLKRPAHMGRSQISRTRVTVISSSVTWWLRVG